MKEQWNFRRSTMEDIDSMCVIAEDAKVFLRNSGVSQWQRGTYPSRNVFEQDVRDGIGYVVTIDEKVAAFCAVTYTDEASYHTLREGTWLSDDETTYATIHRSAVSKDVRGKGVIGYLFEQVIQQAVNDQVFYVRVDTHGDNQAMQHALEKAGFIKCGILTLVDGDEIGDLRLGYELACSH